MKRTVGAIVVAVLVLCSAAAGFAAGSYDGVWAVVQSNPTKGTSTFYLSIHEDNGSFLALVLNLDGTWAYVLGVESSGTAYGTGYNLNQTSSGTFSVTFTSATAFTGTFTGGNNTFTLTGSKAF
jgi:hypothetical protein